MERQRGSPPFVIQFHPYSMLFEVLSREIGFDHVDLMNLESRERQRKWIFTSVLQPSFH